jgi:hypothetical protein
MLRSSRRNNHNNKHNKNSSFKQASSTAMQAGTPQGPKKLDVTSIMTASPKNPISPSVPDLIKVAAAPAQADSSDDDRFFFFGDITYNVKIKAFNQEQIDAAERAAHDKAAADQAAADQATLINQEQIDAAERDAHDKAAAVQAAAAQAALYKAPVDFIHAEATAFISPTDSSDFCLGR